MKKFVKYLLLCPLSLLSLAGQSYNFDFSTPVVLAPTETPGAWYPDRFPPNGFVSPVVAPNGTPNTLREFIAGSDLQAGMDNFYNTQGRKLDLPANTLSVTISLYVPSAWATLNGRAAGFWGTVFDSTNAVGDYPIIEFEGPTTSDPPNGPGYRPNGGVAGFYGWNNVTGQFEFIGLPAGFTYNSFVQLTYTLEPGIGFLYTVGNPTAGGVSHLSPLSDPADSYVGNTILEGYNYGADYSIFWAGAAAAAPAIDAYQLRYFTNVDAAGPRDSLINLSNTGAGMTGSGLTTTGNICANIYVFDPNEEELACCSCTITPNALQSVSVRALQTSNYTPEFATSGVVKILASAGTCTTPGSIATLAPGLRAWATTNHQTGSFAFATETEFAQAPLSNGELNRLTVLCSVIRSNGSGYGVCPGCTAGGR